MKPKGGLLPLLCTLAALLALPAGAGAKPDHYVWPGGFSLTAMPPKSNGFTLWVFATGHRQVEVFARRGQQFALYRARGTADRNGFSVDMGRFGTMRMRFQGSTHLLDNMDGCKGRRTIQGRGTFQGQLRFRGREDFVSVQATRVRGHFERSFRQVCKGQASDFTVNVIGIAAERRAVALRQTRVDALEARSREEGRSTAFTAMRLGLPGLPVLMIGSVKEKVGPTEVFGYTEPKRDSGSLVFSDPGLDPETAVAQPGLPFTGTGTYAKPSGGAGEWTGDLRAPIAGFGTVDLTGPGFGAYTCHPALETFSGCGE
jgi:hypothetical protein